MTIFNKLIIAKPRLESLIDSNNQINFTSKASIIFNSFLRNNLNINLKDENKLYSLDKNKFQSLKYFQFNREEENHIDIKGHIFYYNDLDKNHLIPQYLLLLIDGENLNSLNEKVTEYTNKLNLNDKLKFSTSCGNDILIKKLKKLNYFYFPKIETKEIEKEAMSIFNILREL